MSKSYHSFYSDGRKEKAFYSHRGLIWEKVNWIAIAALGGLVLLFSALLDMYYVNTKLFTTLQ